MNNVSMKETIDLIKNIGGEEIVKRQIYDIIYFLESIFSMTPIVVSDLEQVSLTIVKEMCGTINPCLQDTEYDFHAYEIIKDKNSVQYYDVMSEDDEWAESDRIEFVIESKTFCVASNSQEILLLIELARGFDSVDLVEEKDLFFKYIHFVHYILNEYSLHEIRLYNFDKVLPALVI